MPDVQLNDVTTWYDVHGDGEPVLLLHGGYVDSRMFAPAMPSLDGGGFRVFTMDRRGQGHTPDVDGPLSYDAMAEDTIAFLDKVVGAPTHLVGHSDGANVALLVALARPDLVRKLVLISGNFHHDGVLPGVFDDIDEESMRRLGARYGEVSPEGADHFPVIARKIAEMGATQPTLAPEDLRAVAAPTLVMSGDDDVISLEHTIALYRGIPDAELAVVRGASHLLVMEKPDEVYATVADFLANDPLPTWQPVRRANPES